MKKEEFNTLLKDLGLNKRDFADITDVPYATIANWGAQRSGNVAEVPAWVKPFLYYYDKSRKLDYVTQEICDKLHATKKVLSQ